MKENYAGRYLDLRTRTYVYSDGSGRITYEQVKERELLKTRILGIEAEMQMNDALDRRAELALLKLKYLTYFSK